MKTSLLIKIIAVVVILAGVGYFVYTNYVPKEKSLVFEARIKEVTVNDNIYTVLVEEYDKKKKEYTTEYEFEINKDTKIIFKNEETTSDKLKANQKVTITSSDVMLPSEPAKLSNVKKNSYFKRLIYLKRFCFSKTFLNMIFISILFKSHL